MAFADLVESVDRLTQTHLGGEPVVYTPEVGAPATVTGIFDEQYVLVQGTVEAGTEALGPAVFFRLSDLPVDPELDQPTITIRGVDYRVTERQPDGIGGIVLELRRR